ncbi:hypothetical protein WN48_00472 [Eufriesea mexicana]|uniref:Uncharacterized protein n=1 Tax=Eufriesea mexicana TaxID=516756 RepID=A0A310S5C3_9HYME|nr:hypothetical protein WN48_00472 [Eufriesea mexicana]
MAAFVGAENRPRICKDERKRVRVTEERLIGKFPVGWSVGRSVGWLGLAGGEQENRRTGEKEKKRAGVLIGGPCGKGENEGAQRRCERIERKWTRGIRFALSTSR